MTARKFLIPLFGDDVAPRFDLATEALILSESTGEERIVVLSQASAEQLCHLILTERVSTVICNGIEEEYYQYLVWKRVTVIDAVMGTWRQILDGIRDGSFSSGSLEGNASQER